MVEKELLPSPLTSPKIHFGSHQYVVVAYIKQMTSCPVFLFIQFLLSRIVFYPLFIQCRCCYSLPEQSMQADSLWAQRGMPAQPLLHHNELVSLAMFSINQSVNSLLEEMIKLSFHIPHTHVHHHIIYVLNSTRSMKGLYLETFM